MWKALSEAEKAPYIVRGAAWQEFCQEQRPLLPPTLSNAQRERTLVQMWLALSETEWGNRAPEPAAPPAVPPGAPAVAPPSIAPPTAPHTAPPIAPPIAPPAYPSAAPVPSPWTSTQMQLTQELEQITGDEALDLVSSLHLDPYDLAYVQGV